MLHLIENDPNSNWQLFADDSGSIWSIAKPEKLGCQNSFFGNKLHLVKLYNEGVLVLDHFTDYGIGLLSGLHCVKYTPENNKPFVIVKI
jgi:hypothetical protein